MGDWLTAEFFHIIIAAFFVGTIVGLTGMGGGALMTPALIFLGVGDAATVVTADLTAAAVYKSGGGGGDPPAGAPDLSPPQGLDPRSGPVFPPRAWALPPHARPRAPAPP